MFDGVDEVGLDFSDLGESIVEGVIDGGGKLTLSVEH